MGAVAIQTNATQRKRVLYLDVARIVAVVAIATNHAVNRVYLNYAGQQAEFLSDTLLSQTFKAAVTLFSWLGAPLFLMITGALILNKDFRDWDVIKRFYLKNWLPLFIATEILSAIDYCFMTLYVQDTVPEISLYLDSAPKEIGVQWVKGLILDLCFINKIEMGRTWYLDMIVMLYLILPIVSIFIKKVGFKAITPAMLAVFIVGFAFPTFNRYIQVLGKQSLYFYLSETNTFSHFLLFVLVGYYISSTESRLRKLSNGAVVALLLGVFVITMGFELWGFSSEFQLNIGYESVGGLCSAALLFEVIRRYADGWQAAAPQLEWCSKRCFAVYAFHMYFCYILHKQLGYFENVIVNRPVTLLVFLVGSIAFALVITLILQQSKFARKYVLLLK